MTFSNLKLKMFPVLATLMLLVGSVFAQSGTSSLSGSVADRNGAAVPGATVTLTNPSTGFNRSVTTSSDGNFNFPAVPAGTYKLEVKAANFKSVVNNTLKLQVDLPVELKLSLDPGDVGAVVDVTGDSIDAIVNNQDATTGLNFNARQIVELPTDLRRVADLLTLQPAVTREGYVAGGRSDQANITLDGIDINDQQTGGRGGQFQTSQDTVLRATSESVEEFRITTSNPNASQGRSSGAQISLITRRGTNDFSGAVFFFRRPTKGSANDFFNNLAGVERPSLARNVFGGRIGGPIVKDKFFFFYNYEAQREKKEESVTQVVPLAHVGLGTLRFFGGLPTDPAGTVRQLDIPLATLQSTIYPIAGINSTAVNVLRAVTTKYASNTTGGDGINTGGFRFNSPTSDSENTHIVRFDYLLNSTQSLYLRGNYQYDLAKGTSAFPDTPQGALWQHPWGFVVGHDWSISSTKVNNFRYGLTRQAFSTQGDSNAPSISFRFMYSPLNFTRTLSRTTPTQNFTDDFTWIKGSHTIQMGGNVRVIRNNRVDYGNAFDSAITNPSFYASSGRVLDRAFSDLNYNVPAGQRSTIQTTAAALIGRFSQYSGNFTFDLNGNVLAAGTPTERTFATEEYDSYFQDIWKPFRNLTITAGVRYGISRPVYEKNGYQVVPSQRLGEIFALRQDGARRGVPYNGLVNFEKAGPVNKGQGFYSMDWNNLQPRISVAWSPNFENKYLKAIFGSDGKSVVRGGFALTNDYFGQQLAVSFSGLSSIGFTSSAGISANTYNITTNLAPLFTGFGQNIRALPGIPAPTQRFATDATPGCLDGTEECPQRIESSLDGTITTPTHYSWNVSYGRELPGGLYVEGTYLGRKARNLLGARDVMALNNFVDTRSGMDWYTAAGMLHDLRARNTPVSQVGNIPYFQNLFPGIGGAYTGDGSLTPTQEIYSLVAREGVGGFDILDWTFVQLLIDDLGILPNLFYHPQYAAFSSFGSFAKSDYNAGSLTVRQRLGDMLTMDLNYTYSKSMDSVSGLQTGGSYGSQFLLNPLRPEDNYAASDFDARQVVNANFIFQLPVGRGKKYFNGMGRALDAVVGGWQLAGVYRWNSGLPISVPFDAAQWATNWNVQSNGTRIRPVEFGAVRSTRNAFVNPQAAFNSFRNARPGETGERNVFRAPGYSSMDMSLSKTWKMPFNERHAMQFRMEVFNVTNVQYFDAVNGNFTRSTYGLPQDPDVAGAQAASDFGQIYQSIQGTPRFFQFGFRYSF